MALKGRNAARDVSQPALITAGVFEGNHAEIAGDLLATTETVPLSR